MCFAKALLGLSSLEFVPGLYKPPVALESIKTLIWLGAHTDIREQLRTGHFEVNLTFGWLSLCHRLSLHGAFV